MGNIAQKLRSLPNSAGVYQYIDSSGRVLYIGKAKSLKNRVKSYFSLAQTLESNTPIPNTNASLRIASMVRQIENIEILLVDSEQDALILENSLIKQLKPKYNVLLRDDKTYPYIAFDLTKDFPSPSISRARAKQKGIGYFGPFVSGAREIISSLLEMYPLVQKSSCLREKKACLFYQIGRCSAPCEGKIHKDSYAKIVEEAITLLKSPHKLLAKLKEKMLNLSQSQQYEEAGIYRDRIKKLQNLQSFSTLDLAKDVNVDVLYFYFFGNSPAGNHCGDLALCHEARTASALTSSQSAKNSTSTTSLARIVESSPQDSSENSPLPCGGGQGGWLESSVDSSDSVIASERSERGNLFHCHTEGNARSISTNNKEIFRFAQYDKNNVEIDCQALDSIESNACNDNEQKHIKKTQKGILLSLFVRGGKVISIQNEIIPLNQYIAKSDNKEDKILLDEIQAQIYTQAILNQYSSKLPIIPSEILLPSIEGLPRELLSDFLLSTQGRKISLSTPQIGIKAKILALAKANAKDLLAQHSQKLQQESAILERLAQDLKLDSIPHRIEVFDTSHHSGKDCVGAMIVYENGEFIKSSYRRYLLSGSDEYSQMREMLIRRAKDFTTNLAPNLWLIDGGKAQIALAKEVLDSCGLSGNAIDIIGIAKEKKEVQTPNTNINETMLMLSTRTKSTYAKSKYANRAKGAASDTIYTFSDSFLFSPNDEALQFLQKLRDEAHRFAITFHREKKKTSALESAELKRRNLNQAQVKRLLSLMGSFERIKALSDKEIQQLLKTKRATNKGK